MASIRTFVFDSFAPGPFMGNPAAVCCLQSPLSEKTMQLIAREMNLSETAFVYPVDLDNNTFFLRWFTPKIEVSLCGHATLATAAALFGHTDLLQGKDLVHFQTSEAGVLRVKSLSSAGNDLEMDLPRGEPAPVEVDTAALCAALGISTSNLVEVQFCPVRLKLLVRVDNVEVVLRASPDFDKLVQVDYKGHNVRGVIVTAAASTAPDLECSKGNDFVSRYFAPWAGIPEDPVTGSAHCVLGVYWGKVLENKEKEEMGAYQASPGRGGQLRVQLEAGTDRVFVRGKALLVLKGELFIEQEN